MKSITPIVEDRLDRVLTNPTSAIAWHRLVLTWQTITDTDIRKEVIDRLISGIPDDPIPDFLRSTFIYGAEVD